MRATLTQLPRPDARVYRIEEEMENLEPFRQAWAILETFLTSDVCNDEIAKGTVTAASRLIEAGIKALAPEGDETPGDRPAA